jgi:hypothetical protein
MRGFAGLPRTATHDLLPTASVQRLPECRLPNDEPEESNGGNGSRLCENALIA